MEIALVVFAFLFLLAGLIGSIVPAIPGPPISYLGLWFLKWSGKAEFSYTFLIVWAVITIIVMAADYFLPAIMTKKFGGSKKAIIGSVIGLIIGMFFAPIGLLAGPFFGAFVGELIHSNIEAAKVRRARDVTPGNSDLGSESESETEPEPESEQESKLEQEPFRIFAGNEKALFAALGAFLAFILGTGAKLIIVGMMIFFAIRGMVG